jgi:hypothetical protein
LSAVARVRRTTENTILGGGLGAVIGGIMGSPPAALIFGALGTVIGSGQEVDP